MHRFPCICTHAERKARDGLELNMNTALAPGWRDRSKSCGLPWARTAGVSSIPITAADALDVPWRLRMECGIWVACDGMYAHTCLGLSAPSAAESLVYSNSTLGPKLPVCWPPKPACLFQPFWPPVSKLGKKHPPFLADGEYASMERCTRPVRPAQGRSSRQGSAC